MRDTNLRNENKNMVDFGLVDGWVKLPGSKGALMGMMGWMGGRESYLAPKVL